MRGKTEARKKGGEEKKLRRVKKKTEVKLRRGKN